MTKSEKHQTIALCMIVKNEATVITRAFDSVKNFVDYYCICDTGSSDGTQDTIRDYFKEHNLSGEVYNREWVDFAHNRTEAFEFAKGHCDYLMTLDADEVIAPLVDDHPLLTHKVDELPKFEGDRIDIKTKYDELYYTRTQFYKDGWSWKWHWPVHEICQHPHKDGTPVSQTIKNMCNIPTNEGARAKYPQRYKKDALVLERWLVDNPKDARAWFYLAQSYRDAREPAKGLDSLDKCIEFSQWDEEIWACKLRQARYRVEGGHDPSSVTAYYLDAYNFRPSRAEPLHDLLSYYRYSGRFVLGVMLGEIALSIPMSKDILFVEEEIYRWKIKDELSICYYWTNQFKKARKLMKQILRNKKLQISEEHRDRIIKNVEFCDTALAKQKSQT